MSTILITLQGKLLDSDRNICQAAVNGLATVASHASPTEVSTILITLQDKLLDSDSDIRQAAVNGLAAVAPYALPTEVSSILTKLEESLMDGDKNVFQAAATIALHASSSEFNTVFTALEAKLMNKSQYVRQAALESLVGLVAHLPYVVQKQFLDNNGSILAQLEHRKLFYQLINAVISHKDRKNNELQEIFRLVKSNDPIVHTFATNFNHLLDEHTVHDSNQASCLSKKRPFILI